MGSSLTERADHLNLNRKIIVSLASHVKSLPLFDKKTEKRNQRCKNWDNRNYPTMKSKRQTINSIIESLDHKNVQMSLCLSKTPLFRYLLFKSGIRGLWLFVPKSHQFGIRCACMCMFLKKFRMRKSKKRNPNLPKSQDIFNIVKRIQITIPSKANGPWSRRNETQLKSVFVSSNNNNNNSKH